MDIVPPHPIAFPHSSGCDLEHVAGPCAPVRPFRVERCRPACGIRCGCSRGRFISRVVARLELGLWVSGFPVLCAPGLLRHRSACAHGLQLCNSAQGNLGPDTVCFRVGHVPPRLNVLVSMGSLPGRCFLHGGAVQATGHIRPTRSC